MSLLNVISISRKEAGAYIVKDISFTQKPLQKIAVAGETGSGKSTLLKMISGLVQPDAGEAWFEGEKVKGPEEKLLPGHPGIAYLSQHFELRNNYRVHEVLEYANNLPLQEAATLYEVCRISHLLHRKTDQLSGGERQRIALARILVSWPRLLLLDEPFSNLDIIHKRILKSVIHDIGERLKITCILVSHDPQDILSWADEIIVLRQGQVVQKGSPEQVYRQPADEYTGGLFGNYNLIKAGDHFLGLLPGIDPTGKDLFIRPELLTINKEQYNGLTGIVKQISFFGSYYEIEVSLPGENIIVRANACALATGDVVSVSISAKHVWYV